MPTPGQTPVRTFEDLFNRPATVRASAPGRVNLIGEHTDYNGGFVLPAAIAQRTRVEAAPAQSRTVRLWSRQFSDLPIVEYELGDERRDGRWADYVKGMTRVLGEYGLAAGFDARIESSVPVGGGLSSSAALEIAIGRALRTMFELALDDIALALAARKAENEFVGAPVGIMDQLACSLADSSAALFIDTRSLAHERVPLPASSALIVIDSGIAHQHASGQYRQRRSECAAAAAALGVRELRDAGVDLAPQVDRLPPPLNRRARHVLSENQRVLDTVAALRADDLERAGELLVASHASMRDDFEVSVAAMDTLVAIACGVRGVYGARMTGGGFGGAMVCLADAARSAAAAGEIVEAYGRITGESGSVIMPLASGDAA